MSKYVVCKKDFEYNDEIFYSHTRGGVPLKLYDTEEEAEAEATRRTVKALKEGKENLAEYCYGPEDIIGSTGLSILEDAGVLTKANRYCHVWDFSQLDDKTLEDFVSHLKLQFYEVYRVEED